MNNEKKLEIFNKLLKLEKSCQAYQESIEQGKGDCIINYQFNWTVRDCQIRTMAKVDAIYSVLKILGINKEYLNWSYEKSLEKE